MHHLGRSHNSICLLLSHGMSILNLQVRSLVKLMLNGCLKINSVTFFPQLDLTCLFGSYFQLNLCTNPTDTYWINTFFVYMCVHNWMWISCLVNINMRHFGHNVRSSIRDLEVFVKCQSCYATYEHNQGHRQRVDSEPV